MSEARSSEEGPTASGEPGAPGVDAGVAFVDVGEARRLREGGSLSTVIDGRAIVVFRSEGLFHAVSDRCPHNGLPLRDACVERGIITCRWHGWQFELATGRTPGQAPGAEGPAIRVYATRVEAGRLFVGPPLHSGRVGPSSTIPGEESG